MERTNENIVSSYFVFMWNNWNEDECKTIFGYLADHIWKKWAYHHGKIGAFGSAERLYSELDCINRQKLVERACEMYNGDRRSPQPKDEPIFWTNNVNKAALERHGYDTTDVSDDDLIEIAGIMGDYYADSRYSFDLETACDQLGIPKAR